MLGTHVLRTVQAPGSRELGVAEWGDPDGKPVFFLHGTPGSRLRRPPDEQAIREAGLRVITYDRPGYGASDRHAGRRVVDCVADVAAIADDLGLDRFHVAGGSGGGPHALALAARLSERVGGVDCMVSPAPRDAIDLDWFAAMDPENVQEFGWALDGEDRLHSELTREAAGMLARLAANGELLGAFDLEEADRELLQREDVQRTMNEMLVEAFRNGVWGWVDDDLALIDAWGFDLDEIAVPVVLRYGLEDVLVPAGHGEWLGRHVPGARVVVDETGGHIVSPEELLDRLVELSRT